VIASKSDGVRRSVLDDGSQVDRLDPPSHEAPRLAKAGCEDDTDNKALLAASKALRDAHRSST
jgi:hypothetical protein